MSRNPVIAAALALWLCGCAGAPRNFYSPPSGPTVWNFNGPGGPLAASTGTAILSYRDAENTGWGPKETVFAKARALGLPPVNKLDPAVMAFPAAGPAQGYTVEHNSPPNGVYARDGLVSNYTVVMDLLLPDSGGRSARALQQAGSANDDDADMFVSGGADGALGTPGLYHGAVSAGTWHRLAWAVQCAVGPGGTGQLTKFVDGRFAGGHYTPGNASRCRWALDKVFHLFTDDNGQTGRGFISSLLFTDRVMGTDELAALGGPSGRGADVPGPSPAPAAAPAAKKRALAIAHRANTGNNPENTLAGIRLAFDAGADIVEVRLSLDGVPVLMHDEDLRRTTNGSGPVSGKSLRELKALDAGSWFDPRFAGERVPTLAEALQEAKGRGVLFLDIKGLDMGHRIKRAMKQAGAGPESVWLSQGNTLAAAADYAKNIPGAKLIWEGSPPEKPTAELFDSLKRKGYAGFDIDIWQLKKEFIDAAHAAGMFVSVYTVLAPDDMLRVIEMGADAMETDYPAALKSLLPPK